MENIKEAERQMEEAVKVRSEIRLMATELLLNGQKPGRQQTDWMNEIIRNYPDTDLAKKAKVLLQKLPQSEPQKQK